MDAAKIRGSQSIFNDNDALSSPLFPMWLQGQEMDRFLAIVATAE
jgi:hypothetical protein